MIRLIARASASKAVFITFTVMMLAIPTLPQLPTAHSVVVDGPILPVPPKLDPQGPPSCCFI
jgi:hypothetical protein